MIKKAICILVLFLVSASVWPQARELDCRSLLKEGGKHLAQFQAIEAVEKYRQALELARSIEHYYLISQALMGVSQATWYAGNFQQAAVEQNE
jgi:hypothetical protein